MAKIVEANERAAQDMPEAQALEDKKKFIKNLGWLLSQTTEHIADCELMVKASVVKVTYDNGCTRYVGISGDSYMQIIRDVI